MKVTIELDVDSTSEYSLVEAEKTIRFLKKTHFPRRYNKKLVPPENTDQPATTGDSSPLTDSTINTI